MVSDFLVAHPSSPFFFLDQDEWNEAIKKYPSLLESSSIHYEGYSCTGGIVPGQEGYLDNQKVLEQFERLFQMLKFKNEYKGHKIEIVVDNARTHTSQMNNLNDFR
jgi:hypothetical protein